MDPMFAHGSQISSLPGNIYWVKDVLYWEPHRRLDIGVVPALRSQYYAYIKGLVIRNRLGRHPFFDSPYFPSVKQRRKIKTIDEKTFIHVCKTYGIRLSPRMQSDIIKAGGKPPRFETSLIARRGYLEEFCRDFWEKPDSYFKGWNPGYSKFFWERKSYIIFMDKCFNAFSSSFKVSNRNIKFGRKLKKLLLEDPSLTATKLKEFFSEARCRYFDCPPKKVDFSFLLEGLSSKQLLTVSLGGRALPAPLASGDSVILDTIDRLTTESDADPFEEDQFHSWFARLIEDYAVDEMGVLFYPSTSASIEISREEGGQRGAYQSIINYQKARYLANLNSKYDNFFHQDPMVKDFLDEEEAYFIDNKNFKQGHQEFIFLIAGALNLLSPFIEHSRNCEGCDVTDCHPPACPLLIKEKGLKFRVPTMCSVAESLVSVVLRSLFDRLLDKMSSTALPIKGEISDAIKIAHREKGNIRSLDLSFATDNHSFRLTREVYFILLRRVSAPEWLFDVARLVTGPHEIFTNEINPGRRGHKHTFLPFESYLTYEDSTIFHKMFLDKPRLFLRSGFAWSGNLRNFHSRTTASLGYSYEGLAKDRKTFKLIASERQRLPLVISQFEKDWGSRYLEGMISYGVTKKGQLMGLATSWPVLPLITLYCFQTVKKKKTQNLAAFGDDAYLCLTPKENIEITSVLRKLGSIPSGKKDFYHPTKGMFTESFFESSSPVGLPPLSAFLAPTGVRENNWFTAPQAFKRLKELHHSSSGTTEKFLMQSPFLNEWMYASRLGIPLHFPVKLGGIGLPSYLRGTRNNRSKVLSYFMNKSFMDMFSAKGRLSIVPSYGDNSAITKALADLKSARVFWYADDKVTDKTGLLKLSSYRRPMSNSITEMMEIRSASYAGESFKPLKIENYKRPKIIEACIRLHQRLKPYPLCGIENPQLVEELLESTEKYGYYSLFFKEKYKGSPLGMSFDLGQPLKEVYFVKGHILHRGKINEIDDSALHNYEVYLVSTERRLGQRNLMDNFAPDDPRSYAQGARLTDPSLWPQAGTRFFTGPALGPNEIMGTVFRG